jgi:catechol 2,3-dioxygenase-like lactoylglutathione lyase family enzyme
MKKFATDVLIELHVPDFEKILVFYPLLGFEVAWSEPNYLVLRRGVSVLCFYGGSEEVSEHSYFSKFPKSSPRGYGVEIVLFEEKIESLFEKLKPVVQVVSDLQSRHWGVRDFRIADPFGFYIRVSEPYDTVNRD